MGAQRAEAQPESGTTDTARDWVGQPETSAYVEPDAPDYSYPEERRVVPRVVATLLLALALLWTGAAVWSIMQGRPAITVPNVLQWTTFVSPPLILIGIAWLILGHTPRRETERFRRAVAAMRNESTALESVLAIVGTRIEENHAKLRNEAGKLMSLGDEASDRLGRVAHYLSKESANLDKKSTALEAAAEAARIDIGVLLQDLPRAEEHARSLSEAMKEAGLAAHSQTGALEGQLSALVARGREADEVVGGAAQRLAAHLARVESTTAAAATRMDEAAASMTAAVDDTMARAAEAVDAARSGLQAQGAAMLAMIEQSRAALDRAGEDAGRNLAQRLENISGKIESLAGHLAAQDAASHALVTGLAKELTELDQKFAQLGQSGTANAEQLGTSIETVRARVNELAADLTGGQDRAANLIERAHEMAQALTSVTAQLNGDVPAALARVEEQADRARATALAISPDVLGIEAAAGKAAASLAEAEAAVARQREALETTSRIVTADLMAQLTEVEGKFAAVRESGGARAGELGAALASVSAAVSELADSLDGGQSRAAELSGRADGIRDALAAINEALTSDVPAGLSQVEQQAERTRGIAADIAPQVQALQAAAVEAGARLAEAEASVNRQQAVLETTARTVTADLLAQLAEVEQRFTTLGEHGAARANELGQALTEVRESVAELATSLNGGQARAAELSGRAEEIRAALAGIADALDQRVPAALTQVEQQAERARATADAIAPGVEALQASAESAASRLAEAEGSVGRQREALDALLARLDEGVSGAEAQLRALGGAVTEADEAAGKIVQNTSPDLIEALLRVRETATQAAERAREAIAAVIPQSAAALADASREALGGAVSETVERQMAELGDVAERAVETARKASERLTRQMLTIGEAAGAVEARIEKDRQEREARDSEQFSRRVALLIESLNSTAIDVTKILSNEVTDSAWASYLKGDRGVFTRRAVRLIDNSEAREIVQHYENEPEFREQVNRYIHDFEAMLRRVLADRDSSALGITLLSSDMGKLYVALAQAIERLRS
jgi:predicted  nucleic acid-binding Zn-ribbon protein